MDIKAKIVTELSRILDADEVRLEDDDGISGFVVSRHFEGMSALDRQLKIDDVLIGCALSPQQRRRILMIAGVTPDEYEAVVGRIRVHKVKEMAGGAVEILLHGGLADAQFVRDALKDEDGVKTTAPKPVAGANGSLMSFRAKPLTKKKTVTVLSKNRYIEVLPNA